MDGLTFSCRRVGLASPGSAERERRGGEEDTQQNLFYTPNQSHARQHVFLLNRDPNLISTRRTGTCAHVAAFTRRHFSF